jgi:hypothetical protein
MLEVAEQSGKQEGTAGKRFTQMKQKISAAEKRVKARIGSHGGAKAAARMSPAARKLRAQTAARAKYGMTAAERLRDFEEAREAVAAMRAKIQERSLQLIDANPWKTAREIAVQLEAENKFTLTFQSALAMVNIAIATRRASC